MIISLKEITKYFGTDLIIDKASAGAEQGSRIGIIGANGAGKSTLLNILTGALTADSGSIYIHPDVKLGYLTQNSLAESTLTVYEEMRSVFAEELKAIEKLRKFDFSDPKSKYEYERLTSFINARDAYNTDVKINTVLNGMGFTEMQKKQPVSLLSGGERTRLALARLLITDSDVLLLDEPTNHLDFTTSAWLEGYLEKYKGTVISVTHDRYYLDKVCDRIWELEFSKITEYAGNYSDYKKSKAQRLEEQQRIYDAYLEKRNKLEDYVARNLVRASTSAMAKSRRHELERMETPDKPREYTKQIHINFRFYKKSWFDVLKINNICAQAGGKQLFSGLTIDVKAGERIAFIGENGVGKTTLFHILDGTHDEYTGKYRWGNEVSIGSYEQRHIYANQDMTVRDELWNMFPALTENQIRSALASVLFTADDIYKKVSDISGGESARLQLAILSLEAHNTLMLDEPTNHLDMMSKEELEKALLDFPGTELVISHDRYFLNTIPDKIVYLSRNSIIVFNGKFDELMSKIESEAPVSEKKEKQQKNTQGYTTKEQRAKAARKRAAVSECEKKIAELESAIKEYELIIESNTTDYEKLQHACTELEKSKKLLDKESEIWLELSEDNE